MNRPRISGPARIWGEIGLMAAIYLVILWGLGPHMAESWPVVAVYWGLVALGTAVVLQAVRQESVSPGPGLATAWPPYLVWTVAAGGVLVALALHRDPGALRQIDPRLLGLKFAGYLIFALIQATAFFGFLQRRLERLLQYRPGLSQWGRRGLVAAGVGGVFCLCHAPNPAMMLLTLIGGVAWSLIFSVRPNLWLLSLSHAVLGTLTHRVLLLNTRIGPFYAHPDLHILQQAVPGLRQVFGNLF